MVYGMAEEKSRPLVHRHIGHICPAGKQGQPVLNSPFTDKETKAPRGLLAHLIQGVLQSDHGSFNTKDLSTLSTMTLPLILGCHSNTPPNTDPNQTDLLYTD